MLRLASAAKLVSLCVTTISGFLLVVYAALAGRALAYAFILGDVVEGRRVAIGSQLNVPARLPALARGSESGLSLRPSF